MLCLWIGSNEDVVKQTMVSKQEENEENKENGVMRLVRDGSLGAWHGRGNRSALGIRKEWRTGSVPGRCVEQTGDPFKLVLRMREPNPPSCHELEQIRTFLQSAPSRWNG